AGLGLGLAIVRHIVELHGGRVRVSSDGRGKGATFRISLPVVPSEQVAIAAPDAPKTEAAQRAAALHLSGARVLVVDDDQDARELVMVLLRSRGAQVTTV